MTTTITSLALALALIACGDDKKANTTPDASVADAAPATPHGFVVSGTFAPGAPGVLSKIDVVAKTVTTNVGPADAVGDDPVLRHYGHELFIVNRSDSNNVTILDDTTLALVEQIGTGANSNPQDVAVVGNKLFVPVLGGKGVAVLTRGSQSVGVIDLSVDDADGKPNCQSIFYANNELYVSCGLLDDTMKFLPPRGPGKVYVVDPTTQQIKTTLTLSTKNPISLFEQVPSTSPQAAGDLLLPTIDFADGAGCIERITPGATPVAAGCLFDNTALGPIAGATPYASRLAFQIGDGATVAWVAVPTAYPKAELRAYDFTTKKLWEGPLSSSGEAIGDVASCASGDVIAADFTANTNGIRFFANGVESTKAPISIGLAPASTHGVVCF